MKNPFRRQTKRELLYDVVQEALSLTLHDKESVPRQLLAIMARSETKNFFALHLGTELEKFERELEQRSARALATLGSAAGAMPAGHGATCTGGCSLPDVTNPGKTFEQHTAEALAASAEKEVKDA